MQNNLMLDRDMQLIYIFINYINIILIAFREESKYNYFYMWRIY